MKKIVILAAAAGIISSTANAQLSFAPEIGINLANMHGKMPTYDTMGNVNGSENDKNKLKLGVRAGVNLNIPVGERIVVQPGLFYSIKGYKNDESSSETIAGTTFSSETKNNVTLHYFEVPVNIQYMFNDPSEGRFFVGVGGFIGVAFSGHNKYSSSAGGGGISYSVDTTVKLTFGDDKTKVNTFAGQTEYRRIDGGVQLNVGYLLRSGLFFRGMYQWGLTNLVPGESSNNTLKSSNIIVSLGYQLGGSPKGKGPRMHGSMPE